MKTEDGSRGDGSRRKRSRRCVKYCDMYVSGYVEVKAIRGDVVGVCEIASPEVGPSRPHFGTTPTSLAFLTTPPLPLQHYNIYKIFPDVCPVSCPTLRSVLFQLTQILLLARVSG
jgi:hypothetical protein